MSTVVRPAVRRIALAGNPNVGKTTVFNLLTGLHQKVANYPGVTVERKTGRLVDREDVHIVDLPGTYSLNPKSLDERVAYDVLVGRMRGEKAPDVVVCVVDATNLERNLYLASQIIDLGLPVVVALNMMDAAGDAGLEIDVVALAQRLGTPVVPLTARRGEGITDLRRTLFELPDEAPRRKWSLMPAVDSVVSRLAEDLSREAPETGPQRRFYEALAALTNDTMLGAWVDVAPDFHAAVLDARRDLTERRVPFRQAETIGRYGWLSPLVQSVVTRRKDPSTRTPSDRLDAVLTHRLAGPAIFLGILLLIFQAVFSWATPAMNAIEAGVAVTGTSLRTLLPDGMLENLLVEGVVTGVGNVLIFLPQILLLFFFLGLMEDTGYMARTSFIMDRIMRRMGLSGGSVIPLLSGYACAIPAIMAARTLDSQRDRLITIMVVPLMSCSARLPVYTLFIAAFIPAGAALGFISYQGLAMLSLYLLGTGMAFFAAWVLKTFVFKSEPSMFVMELPPYRAPQLKQLARRMVDRSKIFVMRAGKIILGMSVLLWVLASFPRVGSDDATSSASDPGRQIRESFIGQFGRTLEPVMKPLGFDWKITAGIVSAFAAREVIVSTLATIYSVGGPDDEGLLLRDALKADRYPDGRPVYTPLVAVSLMVFFVFALQCMSTLAIARRETNTWLWPAVMWGYMFALAYAASFVVYQGGKLLGLGV